MFRYVHILLFIGLQLAMPPLVGACSRSVQESRHTLAVADSLRVHEGRLYDDSMAIADAYATFGSRRLIYSNDYARACYYYGRLLRSRGNQVAAMQAFIAGTHAPYIDRIVPLPWFSDYHILGRIYSNMGTMCHLADEFELSYEMYENASEQILKTNDSTSYYYLLNDMACELAEQKLHDETLTLLGKIETECADTNVLTKTWETKAILYKNLTQYDSAIYAARQLYAHGYRATSGYVTMAQAFWYLEQFDSAVYYAKQVLSNSNAVEQEKYNMLYVIAFCDTTINKNEKLKYSEERTDIDKEILDPLHIQLALSVELIHQDHNLKPNFSYIIIICCIVLLISVFLITYNRHKNRITHIEKKEQTLSVKEQYLSDKERELSFKAQELSTQQHELQQEQVSHQEAMLKDFESTCERLRNRSILSMKKGMADYVSAKNFINLNFNMLADKLEATHVLSEREILFCVLVLIDVSHLNIARILIYSPNSIKKTKDIIAKKLGVTSLSLRNYLIDNVFN